VVPAAETNSKNLNFQFYRSAKNYPVFANSYAITLFHPVKNSTKENIAFYL